MAEVGKFIELGVDRLCYFKVGAGPEALLVFHGFGQDHSFASEWAAEAGHQYTIYFFDLFYHGQSEWTEDRPIEKKEWKAFIGEFLRQENLNRFAVAGYSLGGKFALATIDSFPEKISRIFFLAPDGIDTIIWYTLATGTFLSRKLLKSMILRPQNFDVIIRMFRKLNFLHTAVLRFAESQMNTQEKRQLVFNTWVNSRFLKFNMKKIASTINARAIPVTFALGKFDKIITQERIMPLASRITKKDLVILPVGHNDIPKASASLLLHR